MKINKKGQIEDFADWLILVIGIILLMIFFQMTVMKAIEDKSKVSVAQVDKTINVDDYLAHQRYVIEQGKTIEPETIIKEVQVIRKG